MSTNVPIDLTLQERHALTHLLETFVRNGVDEAVSHARYSTDLEAAGERVKRLAQLQVLAWEDGAGLPLEHLDAHRADLMKWALETEATSSEHTDTIADVDEGRGATTTGTVRRETMGPADQDRDKTIEHERRLVLIDYAHHCVCERIVAQIDAAREGVPA